MTPSLTQTSCGACECRGNQRGDDIQVWHIFLLMTQLSGFDSPKHTLLSDLLVTLSICGAGKNRNMVSTSLTNDRKQLREVEAATWGENVKLWEYPFKGRDGTLVHTVWRKVSKASQLGHYKTGEGVRQARV